MIEIAPLAVADPLALPGLESELVHRWLVWDAWTAGKRRVDLHPLLIGEPLHRRAVAVAEGAWRLVSAAGARAAADESERARYGLHPDVDRLAAAARAGGDLGSITRVDLLLREDGDLVACEVNADCPGGHNETVALPRLARAAGFRRSGAWDPSDVAARLADRLVACSGGPGSPRGVIALVYATAFAEDLQVCALLEQMVVARGGRAVRIAPTMLRPCAGGLAARSERVAVLYRFYPIEWMAEQRNLDAIVSATARGEVVSYASFAHVYAQSKLAMARAFAFAPAEAAQFFPETKSFADVGQEPLLDDRARWVVKRDLSRVGDHVFVGALASAEEFGETLSEVRAASLAGQTWIAQRFVPQRTLASPWGERFLTLGVYLLDGAFAGYFARLSRTSHCGHDALVLPVFVDPSLSRSAAA